MQLVRRAHTLDGPQLASIRLHGEDETRPHGGAVHLDGTGAANAVLAPEVQARQPEVLAEEVTEQQARLHLALVLDAVHRDRDLVLLAHGSLSSIALTARWRASLQLVGPAWSAPTRDGGGSPRSRGRRSTDRTPPRPSRPPA